MRLLLPAILAVFCSTLLAQQPTSPGPAEQPKASQDSGAPPTDGQRPHTMRSFQRGQGIVGTITAINGNSVTLKSFDGNTATVNILPDTMFRRDQQPAKLSDFKIGDMVFVRGELSGENTWSARTMGTRSQASQQFREGMGKQFVIGEVKAIDGLKLTVARVDGVTQTITVDESTSFRKNGESVTLADVAPGERIFARGELKNGTFVPSVLNIGAPGPMGGGWMAGPEMHGSSKESPAKATPDQQK